jgi:hypothetical protein
MDTPKLASCTPQDVFKAINKLGGFEIKEGAKHTKVIHIASKKSSTIPRHGIVNKNLLKGFVNDFLVKELGYSEKEIYKYLWC